tara:strand:- start:554 stop:694 length:141 start_codon:yes stop_codon:yes gene_type:complete
MGLFITEYENIGEVITKLCDIAFEDEEDMAGQAKRLYYMFGDITSE